MKNETKTMGVVFLTTLIGWIGFSLPFPIFSHLFLNAENGLVSVHHTLETRTVLLGIALALYPLGQIIGAPFLGRLSDRIGRKKVLVWSLMATVIGSLILAFGVTIGSLALVFAGRFLSGLSEGSLAIAQSIAADVSSAKTKARNFAWIGIAIDLGFIAGPIMGGVLGDRSFMSGFDIWLPFWIAVLLFVLNTLVVVRMLDGSVDNLAQKPVDAAKSRNALRMLGSRDLVQPFLLSFVAFWAIMMFLEYFAVYFVQVFETPPAELGVYAALVSIPLIAAGLCVQHVVRLVGNKITGVLSFGLMGGGLIAFLNAGSLAGVILPMIVICIGVNFGQTVTSVIVSDIAKAEEQGQAMGLYRAITVAAGGLSALMGGALAGYSPGYPFMTAILACFAGLFFLPKDRPPSVQAIKDNRQTEY